MTWRRFHVLIKCLSPQSATVSRIQSTRFIGGKPREKVQAPVGTKEAQRAFESIFGPKPHQSEKSPD